MGCDTLVSIAISRAEIATITSPASVPGGIARVGVVAAALAAGLRHEAARLAAQYSGEESLQPEWLAAIKQAFLDHQRSIAKPDPAAAEGYRQV